MQEDTQKGTWKYKSINNLYDREGNDKLDRWLGKKKLSRLVLTQFSSQMDGREHIQLVKVKAELIAMSGNKTGEKNRPNFIIYDGSCWPIQQSAVLDAIKVIRKSRRNIKLEIEPTNNAELKVERSRVRKNRLYALQQPKPIVAYLLRSLRKTWTSLTLSFIKLGLFYRRNWIWFTKGVAWHVTKIFALILFSKTQLW